MKIFNLGYERYVGFENLEIRIILGEGNGRNKELYMKMFRWWWGGDIEIFFLWGRKGN